MTVFEKPSMRKISRQKLSRQRIVNLHNSIGSSATFITEAPMPGAQSTELIKSVSFEEAKNAQDRIDTASLGQTSRNYCDRNQATTFLKDFDKNNQAKVLSSKIMNTVSPKQATCAIKNLTASRNRRPL